jgi:RNA polymerase sigma factor (sigma-70 family)
MSGSAATTQRSIELLFSAGTASSLTDAELLERFRSGSPDVAEAAFESLLLRHGPMVLSVCRRIIRDRHDAEDAFQATFLILATRASSIRAQKSVAAWLHGVALRVASRLRSSTERRRTEERKLAETAEENTDHGASSAEDNGLDHDVLHQEIQRLPRKYREAIVLCYLQGQTQEAAAGQLRCPPSTVGVRLLRARKRLEARLTRRGIARPGGPVVVLPLRHTPPAVPDALTASTLSLVRGTGGTLAAAAARTAAEILKSLAAIKWARIAIVVLASAVAVTAAARDTVSSRLLASIRYRKKPSVSHPVFWIGQRVVTKYATPLVEEGQVVDDNLNPQVYAIRQIDLDLVRIDSSHKAGWVPARELVALDQAFDFYAEEIKHSPSNVEAYYRRGLLRAYRHEWPTSEDVHQAIADLTEAIRLRPDWYGLFSARGQILLRNGECEPGIADYTESIRLAPGTARAELHYVRAWALHRMREYDKALADCNEAARLDPELSGPGLRGSSLRDEITQYKSRRERHLEEIEADIRRGAPTGTSLRWRAFYRWEMKEYDGALSDYREAIRIAPADAKAWTDLAWVLAKCPSDKIRDGREAVESATRACDLTAWKDASSLQALADVCTKVGDFENAERWHTKAEDLRSEVESEESDRTASQQQRESQPLASEKGTAQPLIPNSASPFRVLRSD